MKINYAPDVQLLLSLMFLAIACNRDPVYKYNIPPAQRIEKVQGELQRALQASAGGFRTVYFPKPDSYGGFTFFMKFNEDNTVEMTSNVDDETAPITSRYAIEYGSSVELVFQTYNHIHKLSNTGFNWPAGQQDEKNKYYPPSLNTIGYQGNSNFQYLYAEESGKIHFKEIKRDTELVLEPVDSKDRWIPELEAIATAQPLLALRLTPSAQTPVFQYITVQADGEATSRTAMAYNPDYRNSAWGDSYDRHFGVAFIKTGILIYPPLEYGGGAFDAFAWDAGQSAYIARDGNRSATLAFSGELPANAIDYSNDLRDFVINPQKAMRLYSPFRYGVGSVQSQAFTEQWGRMNESLRKLPLTPQRPVTDRECRVIFLSPDPTDGPFVCQFLLNNGTRLYYRFNIRYEGKLFYLTFLEPLTNNSAVVQSSVQEMLDFFTSDKGLYFEFYGTQFSTQPFSYSDKLSSGQSIQSSYLSIGLTSLENPTLRAYGSF